MVVVMDGFIPCYCQMIWNVVEKDNEEGTATDKNLTNYEGFKDYQLPDMISTCCN